MAVVSSRSKASKKRESSKSVKKASKSKITAKPTLILPFCGEIQGDWCNAAQSITENTGVLVTQGVGAGAVVGTLQTALTGANMESVATIKNKQIGKIILQLQQHHP